MENIINNIYNFFKNQETFLVYILLGSLTVLVLILAYSIPTYLSQPITTGSEAADSTMPLPYNPGEEIGLSCGSECENNSDCKDGLVCGVVCSGLDCIQEGKKFCHNPVCPENTFYMGGDAREDRKYGLLDNMKEAQCEKVSISKLTCNNDPEYKYRCYWDEDAQTCNCSNKVNPGTLIPSCDCSSKPFCTNSNIEVESFNSCLEQIEFKHETRGEKTCGVSVACPNGNEYQLSLDVGADWCEMLHNGACSVFPKNTKHKPRLYPDTKEKCLAKSSAPGEDGRQFHNGQECTWDPDLGCTCCLNEIGDEEYEACLSSAPSRLYCQSKGGVEEIGKNICCAASSVVDKCLLMHGISRKSCNQACQDMYGQNCYQGANSRLMCCPNGIPKSVEEMNNGWKSSSWLIGPDPDKLDERGYCLKATSEGESSKVLHPCITPEAQSIQPGGNLRDPSEPKPSGITDPTLTPGSDPITPGVPGDYTLNENGEEPSSNSSSNFGDDSNLETTDGNNPLQEYLLNLAGDFFDANFEF